MEKRYEIGGKRYTQRPLVLGQLRALLGVLEGIELGPEPTAAGLVRALGERLPRALACVLVEEGLTVKEAVERLDERASELEFSATPEQALEVAEDFFELNLASSVIERMARLIGRVTSQADRPGGPARGTTPSRRSSSSSQGGTSPSARPSSGGSRPGRPSGGSNSARGGAVKS